jgi:hypothetical protein
MKTCAFLSGSVTLFFCLLVSLLIFSGSQVSAQTTNYGTFVGATVTYSNVAEASGTDPGQPFYKAPSITGDTLDFNPTFSATATGGASKIRDAQLNFDVLAHTGYGVEGLLFTERGDFTMTGPTGTSNTLVDITASFFITIFEVDNLVVTPVNLTLSMLFSPNSSGTFTLTGAGGPPLATGNWSGSMSVDLDNALTLAGVPYILGATKVSVALDNTLTALSEAGTHAYIGKKDFKGFSITVVPEPSTLALIGLGAAALLLWRRR